MINGPLSSSQTVDGRVRKRSAIFFGRTALYFPIGTKSKHRHRVQSPSQIRYFSVSTVHCSVSLSASSRHQRKDDVDQGNRMLQHPMIVREHAKQQEHSRLTSNSATLGKRRTRPHKAAWKLNESRWCGGDIQYPLRADRTSEKKQQPRAAATHITGENV